MSFDKWLGFVADVNDDDFKRSRSHSCIYCGDTTQMTRDHVISVSWTGFKRSYAKGDTVQSCRECNSILSNIPLHCVSKRASYIAHKLEVKYRKFLNLVIWDNEELKEMSERFNFMIRSASCMKKYIQSRIAHAVLVSFEDPKKYEVKQKALDDILVYKILNRCYFGEIFSEIEESLTLEAGTINKIITNKQYASLMIAFKYENGINFDTSLLKLFKAIRKKHLKLKQNG